eukprot:363096-Chlamydomonas_euryale.AAC.2
MLPQLSSCVGCGQDVILGQALKNLRLHLTFTGLHLTAQPGYICNTLSTIQPPPATSQIAPARLRGAAAAGIAG